MGAYHRRKQASFRIELSFNLINVDILLIFNLIEGNTMLGVLWQCYMENIVQYPVL